MNNVDEYLEQFDGETKKRLSMIRDAIHDIAPHAVESIAYAMPAYKLNGKPLVYFAAFPNHIGLYATPNGHAAFKKEFAPYKQGKGSVQFPYTAPLPIELIRQVVAYRVTQLTD